MSGGGRPFHPSKILIPEEEDDGRGGGRRRTNGRSSSLSNVYVFERSLLASPIGVEELGPLQVMTATGASLSLALNTTVASTDHLATTQHIFPAAEEAKG